MKTIKQLEEGLKILRENKGNLGENARIVTFRYLEGQLDALKEVLKEIDKIIEDMHKNETPEELQHIAYTKMVLENELKQKLIGK